MADDPVARVMSWDGLHSLASVWQELARRMGASDRPVRRITVTGLDDQGRRTLASLLGRVRLPSQPTVTLDTSRLSAALGLSQQGQLRQLVERTCGPIGNRAADRATATEARLSLWAQATERLGSRVPQTLARIRAAGIPTGDIAAHAVRLRRLADSLAQLPASPPVPLPMIAWQVSGDPHALDAHTTCGRWLQLAAVEIVGAKTDRRQPDNREPDSLTIRGAMRDVGVIVDRLTFTTTTLGLRAQPDTPLGRLIEAAAATRSPVHISGAMLDGHAPHFSQPSWLCVENPALIEAALLAHYDGALLCTAGWPSVDAQRLLDTARAQGIQLRYAGDYDAIGLAIADYMRSRYEATIAMNKAAYLGADLGRAPAWEAERDVPPTPWDPQLANVIAQTRQVVYQEDPAIWRALFDL